MIYRGPGWYIVTNETDTSADLLAPYRAPYPHYAPPPYATVIVAGLASLTVREFAIVTPLRGPQHILIDTPEIAICLPYPRRSPDVG